MGQSIFNLTAPEDQEVIRLHLHSENFSEKEWRKHFSIRFKKAGPRSESAIYETVTLMGVHISPSTNYSKGITTNGKEVVTSSSLNNEVNNVFNYIFFYF